MLNRVYCAILISARNRLIAAPRRRWHSSTCKQSASTPQPPQFNRSATRCKPPYPLSSPRATRPCPLPLPPPSRGLPAALQLPFRTLLNTSVGAHRHGQRIPVSERQTAAASMLPHICSLTLCFVCCPEPKFCASRSSCRVQENYHWFLQHVSFVNYSTPELLDIGRQQLARAESMLEVQPPHEK